MPFRVGGEGRVRDSKEMSNLSYLTKDEKIVLQEFRDKLLKTLQDEVVLIKLFGSKIRGDYHKESDLDLLVILKNRSRESNHKLTEIEWEILDKNNFTAPYLSVVVYSLKEFNRFTRLETPFAQNVNREGITLWDTNQKIRRSSQKII